MAVSPIYFLDYDKISDVLFYFDGNRSFKFNVVLGVKDKDGRRRPFHRESKYSSNKYNNIDTLYSIKRDVNCFFSIDDVRDYTNGVIIPPRDVIMVKMLIENRILPWYMGKKNIFGENPDNNKITITGKWEPQQIMFNDYKFLQFMPIVLEFENGNTSYGIRMCINSTSNFVDISLNTFMEFYYYIAYTDMYNAAINMMNYVKMEPHGTNLYEVTPTTSSRERPKNFFDTI